MNDGLATNHGRNQHRLFAKVKPCQRAISTYMLRAMIRTRFAPSPNGLLHLGHAYAAIVAHDLAHAPRPMAAANSAADRGY
jgi:hypothetical protein